MHYQSVILNLLQLSQFTAKTGHTYGDSSWSSVSAILINSVSTTLHPSPPTQPPYLKPMLLTNQTLTSPPLPPINCYMQFICYFLTGLSIPSLETDHCVICTLSKFINKLFYSTEKGEKKWAAITIPPPPHPTHKVPNPRSTQAKNNEYLLTLASWSQPLCLWSGSVYNLPECNLYCVGDTELQLPCPWQSINWWDKHTVLTRSLYC